MLTGFGAGNGFAISAARLLGKPFDKRCGVIHFALGFGQGFALLKRHQGTEVIGMIQHQLIPAHQYLIALIGRLVTPHLKTLLGFRDGTCRVLLIAVGNLADDLPRCRVVHVQRCTALRLRPLATDVTGLLKQCRVAEFDRGCLLGLGHRHRAPVHLIVKS